MCTKDSILSSRLPRTYHDLQKRFVVRLKVPSKQVPNAAVGEIVVSKIPQGRYKIYYLRPRDRVRQIKSSQSRLQRVGRGQEFNIFYLRGGTVFSETLSSYPEMSDDGFFQGDFPSQRRDVAKSESCDDSIPLSINTDKVLASMHHYPVHVAM